MPWATNSWWIIYLPEQKWRLFWMFNLPCGDVESCSGSWFLGHIWTRSFLRLLYSRETFLLTICVKIDSNFLNRIRQLNCFPIVWTVKCQLNRRNSGWWKHFYWLLTMKLLLLGLFQLIVFLLKNLRTTFKYRALSPQFFKCFRWKRTW